MKDTKYPQEYSLFDQYLCGNKEAGEQLFASAFPSVKKFVFANTKDDAQLTENDKQDIISEAMMRVIGDAHLYNGSCKFSVFINSYAKNIIFEKRREKNREVKKIVAFDDIANSDNIDIFDNPLDIVIEKEKIEVLQKALDILSNDHRTLLNLRFNGMPFKELAALVGKSEDAVDSMFRRAIISLKNNYEKIYNNATDF